MLRIAFALILVMLVLVVCSTVALTFMNFSSTPFVDQWVFLRQYRQMEGTGLTIDWLLAPHNDHRIPIARLLYIADLKFFGGRNILLVVLNFVVQAFGASAFALLAYRSRTVGAWCGAAASGAILFCMSQWSNFIQGWQVTFVLAFAAGTWAIVLFVEDQKAATALAALVVSVLSLANGILAGFAAVVAALLAKRPARRWIALAGLTLMLGIAYFVGYPPSDDRFAYALAHPLDWFIFACLLLGSILRPLVGSQGAFWVGIVGFGLAVVAFAAVALKPNPTRAALLGIAGFSVATIVVLAMGRLGYGAFQAMNARYVTVGAYFWASMVMLAAVAPWDEKLAGLAPAPALVAASLAVAVLPEGAATEAGWGTRMRADAEMLRRGDINGALEQILPAQRAFLGTTDELTATVEFLRRNHLSVFRHE